jgi:hypothetical protein
MFFSSVTSRVENQLEKFDSFVHSDNCKISCSLNHTKLSNSPIAFLPYALWHRYKIKANLTCCCPYVTSAGRSHLLTFRYNTKKLIITALMLRFLLVLISSFHLGRDGFEIRYNVGLTRRYKLVSPVISFALNRFKAHDIRS